MLTLCTVERRSVANRRLPTKEDIKLQIIEMIKRGPWKRGPFRSGKPWKIKPLCKTKVIGQVTARYWHGYCSSWFCCVARDVTEAMNELIEDGKVRYTPGEPLELIS